MRVASEQTVCASENVFADMCTIKSGQSRSLGCGLPRAAVSVIWRRLRVLLDILLAVCVSPEKIQFTLWAATYWSMA